MQRYLKQVGHCHVHCLDMFQLSCVSKVRAQGVDCSAGTVSDLQSSVHDHCRALRSSGTALLLACGQAALQSWSMPCGARITAQPELSQFDTHCLKAKSASPMLARLIFSLRNNSSKKRHLLADRQRCGIVLGRV